jgi:hypothetical protein
MSENKNPLFNGPKFYNWDYLEMPKVKEKTKDIISSVRAIYPNVLVFKDTHEYVSEDLNNHKYCIGFNGTLSSEKPIMIVADYQDSRNIWYVKSEFCITIDEAWESAWTMILNKMLSKFES